MTQITRYVWCIAVNHVREVLLWKSSWMMSSVIWIWTLNSIILSGKKQIMLNRLHLQQHSKNTRNFSSTASTTLLDPHTWRKPKHDTWNQRRNILVRTRLWSMGNSQRNTSIWSRTRYKAFTGKKSIAHCILYKDADETSNIFSSVSFQMITRTAQVLFTRFRHYWWSSWSRGSWTSQRSITFLMVVARNIKLLRTSLIYVPLKRTFPSKQSKFSLQLATGNHRVMKSVVRWNAILRNEVCRDHSTTKFWTIVRCWKYVKKKWNQLFSLALTKKTWSRWERIWRRD